MRHALFLLVLLACNKSPPETAPEEGSWQPTPAERDAMRKLSAHDGFDCADVETGLTDPVPSLRSFVDHVQMPPTVSMRAAHCLVSGHPAEAQQDMADWLGRDDSYGLFRLVVERFDELPAEVQVAVRKAALAGPYADEAAKKLSE